ncbi:hypothetical protein FPV67DRAFT_1423342 [Lyophyllum atratum]|nr:hypothetical protein FPV67DRAFT_1423342 [Lyophyllum atratum]
MSYDNPLHPALPAAQRSRYSSLGNAISGPGTSQFLSSCVRRVPQVPWTPSCKWKLATGRTTQVHNAITFDYLGYSKQGVHMRELSSRSLHALGTMINGAYDQVLAHTGLPRISFRILWPGYEHVEWVRNLNIDTSGRPITRAQLGVVVSQHFSRFVERMYPERATCSEWYLGANGIRFEHLILLSFKNVFENVWQADVAVDFGASPPRGI